MLDNTISLTKVPEQDLTATAAAVFERRYSAESRGLRDFSANLDIRAVGVSPSIQHKR